MRNLFSWLSPDKSNPPLRNERIPYVIQEETHTIRKEWISSTQAIRLLQQIRDVYIRLAGENSLSSSNSGGPIHIQSSSHMHGVIIDAASFHLELPHALSLLAEWRERILRASYIDSMSDIRYQICNNQQEVLHRHYCKPSKRQLEPGNQRFGNIELVSRQINNRIDYIKCHINAYNDAAYDEPEDFGHLIFLLTETP